MSVTTRPARRLRRRRRVRAKVRGTAQRPPEPYKGKGIRYEGEHVQRKVGKRA